MFSRCLTRQPHAVRSCVTHSNTSRYGAPRVKEKRGACGGLRRLPALNNRANHALSTKRRQAGIVSYAPDKPARAVYTADFTSASTKSNSRCVG